MIKGPYLENDWEWQLADNFPVLASKNNSNGPLFELVLGATVPKKQSHLCRRKPNRTWEAGHQECGDPPRERSRETPVTKCERGWPNVEGDRVTKEGDRATVVTPRSWIQQLMTYPFFVA